MFVHINPVSHLGREGVKGGTALEVEVEQRACVPNVTSLNPGSDKGFYSEYIKSVS